MKLSVTKFGQVIEEIDFAQEINNFRDGYLSLLIGRAKTCHVILDERQVSREHAKLTFSKGTWLLSNIASVGEIAVNGSIVKEQELNDGDLIGIGPFILNVSIDSSLNNFDQQNNNRIENDVEEKIDVDSKEDITNLEDELEREEVWKDDEVNEKEKLDNPSQDGVEDEINDSDNISDKQAKGGHESYQADDIFSEEDTNVAESEKEDGFKPEEGDNFNFDSTQANSLEVIGEDNHDLAEIGERTEVAQSFVHVELDIFGEFAPYDKYTVENSEVFIGRDESCQIILQDSEVSSKHAVVKKAGGVYFLEDLQSANGTILNGIRINKTEITHDDEFLIGSTTFTVRIVSDLMLQHEDRLMPVEDNQVVEVEEIVEVGADFSDNEDGYELSSDGGEFGEEKEVNKSLFSKDALKDPEKRKKLLIGVVVLLGLWLLLDDSGKKKKKKPKDKEKQSKSYLLKGTSNLSVGGNKDKSVPKLSEEQEEMTESLYQLAKKFLDQGKYRESMIELDKLHAITPKWKNSKQLYGISKDGLIHIEELKKKEQEEIDRKKKKARVKKLVTKAQQAVKERSVDVADRLFSEILEIDPENYEVPLMKVEIDAWKKEQERKRLEEEQKKLARKRKERMLRKGKKFYLQKKWHSAIKELEFFLDIKDMDEDLSQLASSMLLESRRQIKEIITPLLGKARSLKEGQDLKGAYEIYMKILDYEPDNSESVKEMNIIREILVFRSRKIYREALIAESLSLFHEAKEKFQEVQQISPSDSGYYLKASNRLKDYLE